MVRHHIASRDAAESAQQVGTVPSNSCRKVHHAAAANIHRSACARESIQRGLRGHGLILLTTVAFTVALWEEGRGGSSWPGAGVPVVFPWCYLACVMACAWWRVRCARGFLQHTPHSPARVHCVFDLCCACGDHRYRHCRYRRGHERYTQTKGVTVGL